MSNAIQQLQTQLITELGLVQQFLTVLKNEADVLTTPSGIEMLGASTEQKNQLAELLTQASLAREASLKALGYGIDKAGLEAAAQAHPVLQADCTQLLELAGQASQLNTSNGEAINMYLKHNQQALDTLRSLAGMGNLYDASGRSKDLSAKRKGIKA